MKMKNNHHNLNQMLFQQELLMFKNKQKLDLMCKIFLLKNLVFKKFCYLMILKLIIFNKDKNKKEVEK